MTLINIISLPIRQWFSNSIAYEGMLEHRLPGRNNPDIHQQMKRTKRDTHNGILSTLEKEGNSDMCYNMKFEDSMLSAISQSQKGKICTIPYKLYYMRWLEWSHS